MADVESGARQRRGPTLRDGVEFCYSHSWTDETVPANERLDLVYNSPAAGQAGGVLRTSTRPTSNLLLLRLRGVLSTPLDLR